MGSIIELLASKMEEGGKKVNRMGPKRAKGEVTMGEMMSIIAAGYIKEKKAKKGKK